MLAAFIRIRSMLVLCGLLVLLALGAPVVATAEGDNAAESTVPADLPEVPETRDETLDVDAAELSRTLGIPFDLEREFLERQIHVSELNSKLVEQGPPAFGGLYVDYLPKYTIVVLAEPGEAATVESFVEGQAPGGIKEFVVVQETKATEQALLKARQKIVEAAPARVEDHSSDIVSGTVTIGSPTSEDAAKLEATIEQLSLPIANTDVIVEVGQSVDDVDSYGGLTLYSGGSPQCTTGFSDRGRS